MSFKESISTCLLEKVITLDGRATRAEYWWYALFTSLIGPVLMGCFGFVIDSIQIVEGDVVKSLLAVLLVLLILCQILIFCSSISVTIRRLHDIGKNGLWILISFLPVIGNIVLFLFLIQESEAKDNLYGSYQN